jgi:hypothetical protein
VDGTGLVTVLAAGTVTIRARSEATEGSLGFTLTVPVLVGAGDIAICRSNGDEATAALLDDIPGTVYTLGDNVYPNGTLREFIDCFEPSWGRHKWRTRPAPGNHDYATPNAAGYFEYFGQAAGDEPGLGYYSYDFGAWHVIVLNSVRDRVRGSPMVDWLEQDLAAHPARCTVAYWHHQRFSSGMLGNNASFQVLWEVLYEAHVDIVLNGHDHHYERFAPQTPNGQPDPAHGIREFIVGTGGRSLFPWGVVADNSEVRSNETFGVLKLALHPSRYEWDFIPVAGGAFTDSGREDCHQ